MSTAKLSNKAGDKAHSVVDQLEATAANVEERVKEVAASAGVSADELTQEVQDKAAKSFRSVEKFVKEKPVQAAGIAFAAGLLTAILLRRK